MSRKRVLLASTAISTLLWLANSFRPSPDQPLRWLGPKMPVWEESLTEALTRVLAELDFPAEEWAFTEGDGSDLPYRTVGGPAMEFKASNNTPIDSRTGEHMVDPKSSPFNAAILKLPVGSRWHFVSVARGPLRAWHVPDAPEYENVEMNLIAFGLNMTASGRLRSVSEAYELDLPQQGPQMACSDGFVPMSWHGAEDPRLFWTDAGTPALLFGRFSDHYEHDCRTIGMVQDLRTIFPQLHETMSISDLHPPTNLTRLPGEPSNNELRRREGVQKTEKNWLPFFPGHIADGESLVPHIQYKMGEAHALLPVNKTLRETVYTDLLPPEERDQCLLAMHPAWKGQTDGEGDIHQAAGLYRLTLCERGCVPTAENTVLMGLAHTKRYPHHYGRFVALFNSSFPFNPISAGPRLLLSGLDDDVINFVLSMVPIERADLRPRYKRQSNMLPDHFFLDDQLLISLGHDDGSMMSVLTSVEEMIAGQRLCSSLWIEEEAPESLPMEEPKSEEPYRFEYEASE